MNTAIISSSFTVNNLNISHALFYGGGGVGTYATVLQAYSWLDDQESLVAVLERSYM